MALSLDQERGAWVVYSNLHVLRLGGVPASADMRAFAPRLWQEQTRSPACYQVYNDAGLSAEEYIREPAPRGHTVRVNERTERPPAEAGGAVAANDAFEQRMRRAALWEEAKASLVTPKREQFDTSGFSCRGIVPRPPVLEF